ncbi:MAG: putative inorganic carbon transporter subunit DabA, partial [Planctomycetales bacterium]
MLAESVAPSWFEVLPGWRLSFVYGTTLERHIGPPFSSSEESNAQRLAAAIEHAGHLLPAQGPITVFIHHNTLHALEDLPFDEAVRQGAGIFGCQPYLPEPSYREKLAEGRIRLSDLEAVLRADLGDRAEQPILSLGTRLELRMAMLEFPLRSGPAAELRWFVAETDALRKIRGDAPPSHRERLLANTRRWIMRDVLGGDQPQDPAASPHRHNMLAGILEQFGVARVESWTAADWESLTLQALWRVCHEGAHGGRPHPAPAHPKIRHRDLLLEA